MFKWIMSVSKLLLHDSVYEWLDDSDVSHTWKIHNLCVKIVVTSLFIQEFQESMAWVVELFTLQGL